MFSNQRLWSIRIVYDPNIYDFFSPNFKMNKTNWERTGNWKAKGLKNETFCPRMDLRSQHKIQSAINRFFSNTVHLHLHKELANLEKLYFILVEISQHMQLPNPKATEHPVEAKLSKTASRAKENVKLKSRRCLRRKSADVHNGLSEFRISNCAASQCSVWEPKPSCFLPRLSKSCKMKFTRTLPIKVHFLQLIRGQNSSPASGQTNDCRNQFKNTFSPGITAATPNSPIYKCPDDLYTKPE